MDTITHGIVGALIGKAFFAGEPSRAPMSWNEPPRTVGRIAILACTAGAIFPDIDVFAGPLAHNNLAIMTWHRSITHSVVMLPVWALTLTAITWWLARRVQWPSPEFGDLLAIYLVAIGSHIFLDVITNFGTMLWSPVNYSRVAWDWIFIVDLTFTSLALMPQVAAWKIAGNAPCHCGLCSPRPPLSSDPWCGLWIFHFRRALHLL
jgi:inner membrane protein